MKVKIKLLNEKARIPAKAKNDDFCYDVVATSEEEIAPNVWKYGVGFAVEIVGGGCRSEILSIDFRPRSSVWKTGMVLSNCCGTIDQGYRGEICAIFYHVMADMPRYRVGDRIRQIKLGKAEPIEWEKADKLSDTDRGEGGFGSTGR